MTRPIFYLFILLNSISSMYSQDNINTKFYGFKNPENTSVKLFNSSHEELSNIDVYQFTNNAKPKYLLYLISNKTNEKIPSVNLDNYKDFLFDLGELKISGVEDFSDKVKIFFIYVNKPEIKGVMYAHINNNILNRFVFLLPNQNAKEYFQKEIDQLMNNIIEFKKSW